MSEKTDKQTYITKEIYEAIESILIKHDLTIGDSVLLTSTAMGAILARASVSAHNHNVLGDSLKLIGKAYGHFSGCEVEIEEREPKESEIKFEYEGENDKAPG